MHRTPEEKAAIEARVTEAEASAGTAAEILDELPALAAEAARLDVASGRLHGVRSEEHDRTLGLCRALRDRYDHEPLTKDDRERIANAAVRALLAIGYHVGDVRMWFREGKRFEPYAANPADEMVFVPIVTAESLAREQRQRGGGRVSNGVRYGE